MLYTIQSADWSTGRPLRPVPNRPVFYRSRAEAERFAAGRPTLAVAVRFDAARGVVVPEGPVARRRTRGWSAPASLDATGAVAVQAAIPGVLVRSNVRAEMRVHPATLNPFPAPHEAGISWGGPLAPTGSGQFSE